MTKRRFVALVFAFSLAAYLLTSPGHLQTFDVLAELEVSRSILRHGDFIVRIQLDTVRASDGRTYSVHDPGESLLLLPAVAVADILAPGSDPREAEVQLGAIDDAVGSFLSPVAVSATVALLAMFLLDLGFGSGTALVTALMLGFMTFMWAYAHDSFDIAPATFFILSAVYSTYRFCQRRQWRWLIASAASTALAGLIRLPDFLVLSPLAVYVVAGRTGDLPARLKALALWALPSVGVLGFYVWYNSIRFGSSAKIAPGAGPTRLFSADLTTSLPALLFSPGLGLLVFSPALLIGLFGIRWFVRRVPALSAVVACIVVLITLLYAKYVAWNGGTAWGPRFLLPLAPLVVLPAAEVFSRWRGIRRPVQAALLCLLSLSTALQVASISIDYVSHVSQLGQANGNDRYWDPGASLLFDQLGTILGMLPDLSLSGATSVDGHHGLDFWWVRMLQDGASPWIVVPSVASLAAILLVAGVGLVRAARRRATRPAIPE
jgi:hypothetical protein